MLKPQISIIIPTKNQGQFIEETILSILDQNYPNLQLIIIDGNSSDNTLEIIKKHEKQISYWESKSDNGQSEAINRGLEKCTGEIVNWINSDDKLNKNALNEIVECYNKFPQANLFVGQTIFFDETREIQKSGPIIFSPPEKTFGFGQINQPAMFYKREVFENIGKINEDFHFCMDLDFWLRYLMIYSTNKISISDNVWVYFRFHNNSKTVSDKPQFEFEKELLYKHIFNESNLKYKLLNSSEPPSTINQSVFPEKSLLDIKLCRNYHYLWRADELSINRRKKDAFRFWKRVNPFKPGFGEWKRYLAVFKNIINLFK